MAFYQFQRFDDLPRLQAKLLDALQQFLMKGTILSRGHQWHHRRSLARCRANVRDASGHPWIRRPNPKTVVLRQYPFLRSKVKIKQEIVTMGQPDLDPNQPGEYVNPEDWNALISDPNVVLVDTRNDYEVDIGTFVGAINPNDSLQGFPCIHEENLNPVQHKKVAMFCTEVFAARNPQRILSPRGSNLCTTFKAASCNT